MNLNKKIIIGLVIVAGSITAGVTTFFILNPQVHTDTFESKIQALMSEFEIPSLAAGVVNNESLVWSKGFGDQPDLDTVYMIGSITKTFTATAILQLYESGLLNLDSDINNYLPFSVRNPSYPSIPITPYMLLTHRSGLATNLYWSLEYYLEDQMIDWVNTHLDLGGGDIGKLNPRPSLAEFLNESLNPNGMYYNSYNWQTQPGTLYRYSNAGYQLLGCLIEAVTNQTYMEYLSENIFEPLNMTSTGYDYVNFTGRNAVPYEWYNNSNFAYPFYNLNVIGAGNLRSTIGDMANFIITFINQGSYNGVQILGSNYVDLMLTTQVVLTGESTEGFEYAGYGLGWDIFTQNIVGHGGAVPGFSANMVFTKKFEGDYGMILLFNRGSALVVDDNLITNFIPTINQLIFNEAEKLI